MGKISQKVYMLPLFRKKHDCQIQIIIEKTFFFCKRTKIPLPKYLEIHRLNRGNIEYFVKLS